MKEERITAPKEEMNYLCRFFETTSHKFIFEKAVQLLHDIVKAHELGWDLALITNKKSTKGKPEFKTIRFGIDRLYENGVRIDHKQLEKLNKQENTSE